MSATVALQEAINIKLRRTYTSAEIGDVLSALYAAGYVVVPREPSIEMLQNGRDAYRATQLGGLSGMTIEAQISAQCRREAACWNAMLSAAQEPQP